MPSIPSREVRLKSRPHNLPQAANFEIAAVEAPAPQAGQVQVRNLWMSVDPYMRGRMRDGPSYAPPYPLGVAMYGASIGEVVASEDEKLRPGQLVESQFGWREAFTAPAQAVTALPDSNVPPQAYLGVLGMPGLTAYAGLLRIGQPRAGETVFVSGAAGIVGSVVCQIAKIKGCSVIGSAGSAPKIAWLKARGVDHVVNYKQGDLLANVRAGAPKGLDVYFDNVGGEHLEVAIELANANARFVECGMISQYNIEDAPVPGPRNMVQIVGKQLMIRGFIVTSFADMRPQFRAEMSDWIKDGKVKWEETVVTGIENAPQAFLDLFSGANLGKMLVKLA